MGEGTPDFIGIGAQKGATRWLYDVLKSHSEIYLPPEKELHFFGQMSVQRSYWERFSTHLWWKNLKKLLSQKDHIRWRLNYIFKEYSVDFYRNLFQESVGYFYP